MHREMLQLHCKLEERQLIFAVFAAKQKRMNFSKAV